METRIGVYVCHCGLNIAATVDAEEVARYAGTLPNVVVSRANRYMCSDPGQQLIKSDIKELGVNRVVVAACSPRMHEPTFRKAVEDSGLNPYLYEHANIREHCSWVHDDKKWATEKAKDLVRAAVRRVYWHEPLEVKEAPVNPNVLVVGGGIAGIQAALKVADGEKNVYLIERSPSIGGHMIQLDKTFPTLDCSACILTPKMSDVGHHPFIKLFTYSEIEEISGSIGNFKVKMRKKARYIDASKCIGCGDCSKNCPVRYMPQVKPISERLQIPLSQISRGKRNRGTTIEEVTLEIDGKEVRAEEGTTILEAARGVGIDIPALCYHQALNPYGGCRLCTVEILPEGKSRMVASCVYHVEEGLVVKTRSDTVIRDRKMLIELMLARAPKAKVVQDLAEEYGVKTTRFKTEDPENLCILCGLCTRVCEERIGVSAINFVGRGVEREVQTPFQRTLDMDFDACIACGSCASICPTGAINITDITPKKPIPILSEFEMGLDSKAPIYIPFAQAIPNVATLDRDKCVHFATGECKICQEFCGVDAIDFEQEDEIVEIEVGTIIVATGYDEFDPSVIPQYGYKKYDNVLTGLEFERMTCASGPTGGKIVTKDGREPESVAIVHCVGSRDRNYNEYCSRVCCMYGLKHAHLIKEHTNAEVYEFYIDMRCFGENFEEFYTRVSGEGVNFIRGKVGSVDADATNGKLVVSCVDTLTNRILRIPVDMVILCPAIEPRSNAADVARIFNIGRRADGFFLERHVKLDPVATPTDGIFIAGCCEGPKDIPDTVAQASAAAAEVLSLISKGRVTIEAHNAVIDEEKCSGCNMCNILCPFSAISYEEEKNVCQINEFLCKGCGVCAAACPSGAITAKHFTDGQILAQIEGMLDSSL